MRIQHPYRHRHIPGKILLWVVLVMLVNLWVDVNDWAFAQAQHNDGVAKTTYDDFDSLYEWVAEALFALEDATPENDESPDNNGEGKVLITKITWMQQAVSAIYTIGTTEPLKNYTLNLHETLTNPWQPVWSPPPNPSAAS
jgi:hypothetical protein